MNLRYLKNDHDRSGEDSVKRIGASKKSLALIDKKYKRGMPGTAPSLSVASEPLCWVVDFGRDSNSIGPASSGTPTSATPAKPGPIGRFAEVNGSAFSPTNAACMLTFELKLSVERSKQSPRRTRRGPRFLKTMGTKMGTMRKFCRTEMVTDGDNPKKGKAPQVGLEPTTLRLTAGCSAIELLRSNTHAGNGASVTERG